MIPAMYMTASSPLPPFSAFGLAADRINMLKPGIIVWTSGVSNSVTETDTVVNFVEDWSIGNNSELAFGNPSAALVSLGAAALGPTGDMDARKIVESTSNSIHCVRAGAKYTSSGFIDKAMSYGIVVYAKTAERSRFRLELSNQETIGVNAAVGGVRATYDTSNGTISSAAAVFGSLGGNVFTSAAATIEASLDGWYKCTLSGKMPDNPAPGVYVGPFCTIYLDNGSGTSYVGDGSSGMLFWQARCLPLRAFDITERTFFDDFDSINTIDNSNTQAPGFNWYVDHEAPAWPATVAVPADYSIAGSVLTIKNDPSGGANKTLVSAVWIGSGFGVSPVSGSWVGTHFQLPALMEARAWWNDPGLVASGCPAFWTTAREISEFPSIFGSGVDGLFNAAYTPGGLLQASANAAAGTRVITFAYAPTWVRRVGTMIAGTGIAPGSAVVSATSTTITLDRDLIAPGVSNGQDVKSYWATEMDVFEVQRIPDGPTLHKPFTTRHPFPYHTQEAAGVIGAISGTDTDYRNPHSYQLLWLPATATEPGLRMSFTEGQLMQVEIWQSGTDFRDGRFGTEDDQNFPIWIGAASDFNAFFDWVAIYEAP